MTIERDDIKVLDALDELIDLDVLSFEQSNEFIIGFICDVLLSEPTRQELGLSVDFFNEAKELVSIAIDYFDGKIELSILEKNRYKTWDIYKQYKTGSAEKLFMRIIVFALYDKEASEFDKYHAEGTFEVFVSCLLDLGSKYCYKFKDYFLENLPKILQK